VTLYEFGATAKRSSHPAAAPGKSAHLSAPAAETYGQLREHNSRRRPVEIVGRDVSSHRSNGDPERQSHVLTTDTSALEVFTYDLPGRDDFLLTFTGTDNHDVAGWCKIKKKLFRGLLVKKLTTVLLQPLLLLLLLLTMMIMTIIIITYGPGSPQAVEAGYRKTQFCHHTGQQIENRLPVSEADGSFAEEKCGFMLRYSP